MTDLFGSLAHQHEALSVGDDLRSIEGLFEVINEHLLITTEGLLGRSRNDLAGTDTLLLDGRETTSEDGFTNESDLEICVKPRGSGG